MTVSRRQVLSAAALAAGGTLTRAPAAAPAALSRSSGRSVAVLGGGVAGLTAAQELAERGFSVTLFERKALGGKARSMPFPGTGTGGRDDLPGEHSFRVVFGFYRNLPDTLRRIPFPGNTDGVYGNLRAGTALRLALTGGRRSIVLPSRELARPGALTPALLLKILAGMGEELLHLPAHEAAYFANRLLVLFSSSEERRLGEWERIPWWRFLRAEEMSSDYRHLFAVGLTRNIVAMKAEVASTNTVGKMAEAIICNLLGLGYPDPVDRVLNAPTNEAWIDPWTRHLTSCGVRIAQGCTVVGLECEGRRIVAATVRDAAGTARRITADWFVLAVPAERAAALLTAPVLAADPRLAGIARLRTEWMSGMQYYLRRPVRITHGHTLHVDTPWAVSSISQAQFWPDRDFAGDYGDGAAVDCLSVMIGDWERPGVLFGKPAVACTPRQVAQDTWAQLQASLKGGGEDPLPDGIVHSWFIPPTMSGLGTPHARHDEPLLIHPTGTWDNRPDAATALHNLFLAGDYVRTGVDVASMEGANESARAAVNALLDAAGSPAGPCRVWDVYRPPELQALRDMDARRHRLGLPNMFDLTPST
ncbi:FAD-dependent oxidoreductase [Streptomyces monticola]|uniref:FAD-dependent oxidoreductase n=1 Tax=Streptomyces monticola TaxID=2666263 RepID=A0ABW2JP30_9ACTN